MTPHLEAKIAEAHSIIDDAIAEHVTGAGKRLAGVVILFSGGNDSTTVAHAMRGRATHAAHCNTGIGIEQTRQFVRDNCATWGLPLIEVHPPTSYEQLVIEGGFPGPAQHFKMYQRLKERGLRQVRAQLVADGRRERVVFLSGIRRAESDRRANHPVVSREGAVVWCAPLIDWSNDDMKEYRATFEVPRNEVSDLIHMSGECLCGAFAKAGELDEIEFFFPHVAAAIRGLEVKVANGGLVPEERCKWGWGAYRKRDRASAKSGPLCSSCAAFDAGADLGGPA